ncbi:mannose-binding protein c [Plakobranchus ocellatus]|uniref:Mannose-binding protein c n=1 Tax=Plakobranchus ocellatus TaxID=259542 RepID=A0AAV4BBR7_9GAST|nr:mannose-binding protein c [Plakobranchus ocellatus]
MSLLPILLLLGVWMIASVQGYPGYSERIFNGKKYYINDRREYLNLAQRNARCKEIGAYLVQIDNVEEHRFVAGFVFRVKGYGPYFTGITDEGSEGRYYNFNDKSPAKYLKWRWFQPDNWWGREHCVEIWVNNLNDLKCGRKGRHICEAA